VNLRVAGAGTARSSPFDDRCRPRRAKRRPVVLDRRQEASGIDSVQIAKRWPGDRVLIDLNATCGADVVNRKCRPMLGFKSFKAAQETLAGIELIFMLKKGQMRATRGDRLSPAKRFYALAG